MWEAHNWSKGARLSIGAITAVPVLVGWALLFRMFFAGTRTIPDLGPIAAILVVGFPVMMAFVVFLLYVPAALNNARLSPGLRFLWIVGFVTAGPLVIPFYWFREVMRAPYRPDADGLAPGVAPPRKHARAQ